MSLRASLVRLEADLWSGAFIALVVVGVILLATASR